MTTPDFDTLLRIFTPAPWTKDAACKDADPNLFFPNPGTNATKALTICAQCPVIQQCAEAAKGERYGVWAGTVATDRHPIGTPKPIRHGTTSGYRQHLRRNEPACTPCKEAHATHKRQRRDKHTITQAAPITATPPNPDETQALALLLAQRDALLNPPQGTAA